MLKSFIECPECKANIGPLDGGSLGRHDHGCSLKVEHCAHDWFFVEDYSATTGYRIREESDGVLTLNTDARWDDPYEVNGQWLECGDCYLRRPYDEATTKIEWG